ncbi:LysR family transcriptional regulator [Paenibacillus endoradicis]|uniref:LysR family transcriptional regulator n=1 Tax=Paenibacillus endoradicis TaxID=2972487 RepID=UPI0021599104|nr:LysR family transcriptional regulator [Paenibacillus endoradicis]MCR8656200.1 LysR family transcriptional regulator [Paenibacillus endoradicis]
MNIENIEAFVYVNHYGSFNKAAEVLYLSQPSVTARIQTLERELDSKLFDRLGKQIKLTDKGKQFLPYAQQILQTLQKGKILIQDRSVRSLELRIGSTVSVSNYLIPEILHELKDWFPEITFKLLTAPSFDLISKLLDKEIDLAFVRKLVHPSVQSIPFFNDPIRLYVYKGHPFTMKTNITIQEISEQIFVFFECGSLDWQRVHRVFDHLEHPLNIVYNVDNSETAKKLVLQHAGICFLPDSCAKEEMMNGSLVPIEIEETKGISLQTNLISLTGENIEIINALREKLSFNTI